MRVRRGRDLGVKACVEATTGDGSPILSSGEEIEPQSRGDF